MRPRMLYERPTWTQAREDSICRAEWNDAMVIMGRPDEVGPEPTVLAELALNWIHWITYHVKHWRCALWGHRWGSWENLHDDPETMEDGTVLHGRMTGRLTNCTRCPEQTGQGEY